MLAAHTKIPATIRRKRESKWNCQLQFRLKEAKLMCFVRLLLIRWAIERKYGSRGIQTVKWIIHKWMRKTRDGILGTFLWRKKKWIAFVLLLDCLFVERPQRIPIPFGFECEKIVHAVRCRTGRKRFRFLFWFEKFGIQYHSTLYFFHVIRTMSNVSGWPRRRFDSNGKTMKHTRLFHFAFEFIFLLKFNFTK